MDAGARVGSVRLGWAAALPWVAYAAALGAAGRMRWEHVAVAGLAAATAAVRGAPRRFFFDAAPFFVLFLLYDAMRFSLASVTEPSRVLGCRLRELELSLFGVPWNGARVTLNDLFAAHHHPAVDLLCAIPYGTYLPVMLGSWLYLYASDREAARRFGLIAIITHLLGFATYHVLPAAPPWYVRAHGCAIDAGASMSPAALARVDALLGTTYFHALYGRGSTVFGALPSLHVCYPLYGLLATLRRSSWAARALHASYAAAMAFAALYLDHHYVIDVLLGIACCATAFAAVRRLEASRRPGADGEGDLAPEARRGLPRRSP